MRLKRALAVFGVLAIAGLLATIVPAFAAPGGSPENPPASSSRSGSAAFPHMGHVFVIMMENTSYKDLLSASNPDTAYIRHLATTAGLATHYYGVTHTSLPNYVASISGSTWGSNNDNPAQIPLLAHTNLVDQLEAAHVSWKGYMQSLPSPGYTGDYGTYTAAPPGPGNALYVRKHNPFMLFPDVYTNPARAAHVVALHQLSADLRSGNVPQFSWISPNVCDDMHGMSGPACPYANPSKPAYQSNLYKNGNDFIRTWVTAITHSKAWTGNSSIFVTWDEASYASVSPYGPLDNRGCCDSPVLTNPPPNPATGSGGDLATGTVYGGGHVPMIVVSRTATRPVTDVTPANHYSLLRTVEANWNLPYLGNAGDSQQVHTLAPLLQPSAKETSYQFPASATKHLVVIAMDNTHLTDVAAMPALQAEIGKGTMLSHEKTGLIAYTHPDYTTVGSGDYPSRTGIQANYQYDGPTGVSFSYWNDKLPDGSPTHLGTPPWKVWTAAGAPVGAIGWSDWELENGADATANGVTVTPGLTAADYEGYAVHRPGGAAATFGLPNLPAVAGARLLADPSQRVGPWQTSGWDANFGPDRSLTAAATMLTHGVPVVFDYIRSVHNSPATGAGLTPGTPAYQANLAHYNQAFAAFFAELSKKGITSANTTFVFTSDEGDHFNPGGEISSSLPALMAKAGVPTTGLKMVTNSASMLYSGSSPLPSLTGFSGVPGWRYLASGPVLQAIHVASTDPRLARYSPSAVVFAEPSWYYGSGTSTAISANPNYLWNHGTVARDINTMWAGLVGPSVPQGRTSSEWSDNADILPTLEQLLLGHVAPGLDGLPVLDAVSRPTPASLRALTVLYKQLDAPLGRFARAALQVGTTATIEPQLAGNLDGTLATLVNQRQSLTVRMHRAIRTADQEGRTPSDAAALTTQAKLLIGAAQALAARAALRR